jgi:hypothetical protein
MSKAPSQIILLCEDEEQDRLARSYMKICGINTQRRVKALVASRMQVGGNVGWVLNRFPNELQACRRRHSKASTLLVVVVDADDYSVEERRRHLMDRVTSSDFEELGDSEPAALLIPKRHIETWIRALLNESVTEEQDCKTRKKPTKEEVHHAAQILHQWCRPKATPGPTCVPSLKTAIPEWRKIG